MKKALFYITTITGSLLCAPVIAQNTTPDSLGLPGDNLNLYAVLDLFQKSETLEGFEKSLNAEKSKINNLDLNNDNKVDYIRVVDHYKGTAHAIVLQVPVSDKETQDVAVIEVDKEDENNVKIQVIGDEMLYGKDYIIEPKQNDAKTRSTGGTPNPGYANGENGSTRSSGGTTNVTNNYYNDNSSNYNNSAYDYWYPVASWSIIRWMYYPTYVAYVSPWGWGYNPWYWNAWTPVFWHSYYYGCVSPYWGYYNNCFYRSNMIANSFAHNHYYGRRSTSNAVNQRRNSGEYKNTYSRPDLASKQISPSNRPAYNKTSIASRNANTSAQKVSSSNRNNYSDVKSNNAGSNMKAKENNVNASQYSKYPSSGSANKYNTNSENPAKEYNSSSSKYPSSNASKYSTNNGNPAKEYNGSNSKYPSSGSGNANKYSTSSGNPAKEYNGGGSKYSSSNSGGSMKELSSPRSSSGSSRFNSSPSMGSGSSKPSNFSSGSSRSFGNGGGSSSFGGGSGGGRSFGGGGSGGGGSMGGGGRR